MARVPVRTPSAPPPAGGYSQAIRAKGEFVFISGQTPRTADGARLKDAPFEGQARRALDNLEAVAGAAGLSLKDAVKVNVYLRNPADSFAFDRIYRAYVGDPMPARTLTQSTFTDFDIEIDAILLAGS